MIHTCTHPACRTSLDEYPVECPHGKSFCGNCTFEDGCGMCNTVATAWDAEPDRTWEDPRRQGDIDTAAEHRNTEREYAHHLLMDREEWA